MFLPQIDTLLIIVVFKALYSDTSIAQSALVSSSVRF